MPNQGEDKAEKPWVSISQAQLKKQMKLFKAHQRKMEKGAERQEQIAAKEAADVAAREKNLAEAKLITISENKDLPQATLTKIQHAKPLRDQRIKVHGWVHRLR